MPLLGLPKQWLDPYGPFAHRLLIRGCRVVRLNPLQIIGVEGALQRAAAVAGRTRRLGRAGIAGGSGGAVDRRLLRVLGGMATQRVPLQTSVFVVLRVVAEARGA